MDNEDRPFSESPEEPTVIAPQPTAAVATPSDQQQPEEEPSPYPQDNRQGTPDPVSFCFLANIPDLRPVAGQISAAVADCDLLVSLGGLDLNQLAALIPEGQPAVAVLGSDDPDVVPEQFTVLHGSGVSFQDWKLAGISGGPGNGSSGLYLDPDSSLAMLQALAPCDFFFSHSPPAALEEPLVGPLPAIDEYIASKYPWAVFYAHPHRTVVEPYGQDWDTLALGVHGLYALPNHRYPGA